MKNTTWQLVESGQIVSFRYKSENGRSVNRTVLCLDPEFRYRKKSTNRVVQFFIGLELNASDKPSLPVARAKQLFEILGTPDDTPTQTIYTRNGKDIPINKGVFKTKSNI